MQHELAFVWAPLLGKTLMADRHPALPGLAGEDRWGARILELAGCVVCMPRDTRVVADRTQWPINCRSIVGDREIALNSPLFARESAVPARLSMKMMAQYSRGCFSSPNGFAGRYRN